MLMLFLLFVVSLLCPQSISFLVRSHDLERKSTTGGQATLVEILSRSRFYPTRVCTYVVSIPPLFVCIILFFAAETRTRADRPRVARLRVHRFVRRSLRISGLDRRDACANIGYSSSDVRRCRRKRSRVVVPFGYACIKLYAKTV